MSKGNRDRKHHKMLVKEERHKEKQTLYFIDANVFVEVLLEQPRAEECLNFLSGFIGKQRAAITCCYSIGEVIQKIYDVAMAEKEFNPEKSLLALNKLLASNKIEIYGGDDGTYGIIGEIMDSDNRCGFKDAINIAIAHQFGCACFCTTDSNISAQTLQEFGMKKIEKFTS
ncbi:MAG: type II toxin-antitoxin system VapC family toxin [archaeon]